MHQQDGIEIAHHVGILIYSFWDFNHKPKIYGYLAYKNTRTAIIENDIRSCSREKCYQYDKNTIAASHCNEIGPCVIGDIPFSNIYKLSFYSA